MLYCPNCGTKIKEEEHYCIKCGKALPDDIMARIEDRVSISKWWLLPIISIILVAITIGVYTYIFQHKTAKALELYTEAESLLMEEEYMEANKLLQEALDQRNNFSQAKTLLHYTNEASQIEANLVEAKQLLNDKDYKASLDMITNIEDQLKVYHGSAVDGLVEKVNEFYATTKLEQLKEQLDQGPSFNELRILIWEAEEVNHPEADEITTSIRNRIIDYTFSKASEKLNDKQFNDALLITEDGLKYAPDDEKLQSLLTNINKEKLAFEAEAEKRMEQAMDTAHQEYQMNENDAIELVSVELENNEDGYIVIKGEVKSNATVPINSILVEYALLRNDEEMVTNEIFAFPDTLYPSETGKFEFTHFDLEAKSTNLEAEIKKITWYTN